MIQRWCALLIRWPSLGKILEGYSARVARQFRSKGFPHCRSTSPSGREVSPLTRGMRFFHRSPGIGPFFHGRHALRVTMILHLLACDEGRGRYLCLRLFGEPHAFCIQNWLGRSALSSNNSKSQVHDFQTFWSERTFLTWQLQYVLLYFVCAAILIK